MLAHVLACSSRSRLACRLVVLAVMPTQLLPQPRSQLNLWYATQPRPNSARTTRLSPVINLRIKQATSSIGFADAFLLLVAGEPLGFTLSTSLMWITCGSGLVRLTAERSVCHRQTPPRCL